MAWLQYEHHIEFCIYLHLHNFPENLEDVGDEQSECFHQNLKVIEELHQMRWDVNMIAEYHRRRPGADFGGTGKKFCRPRFLNHEVFRNF